jgi:hypothetical protein
MTILFTRPRIIKSSLIVIGLAMFYGLLSSGSFSTAAHAATSGNVCQTNGTLTPITDSNSTLSQATTKQIALAYTWIKGMETTGTTVTTTSTITPAVIEPTAYTGGISGTYALKGATYSTATTTPSLAVSSPTSVSNTYAGVVSGKVTLTPTSGRWIIQAYKRTSTGTVQVPVQALADGTTGAFSINLSGVSAPAGAWQFGILDAQNSYAPYGTSWPAVTTYSGLQLQELLSTTSITEWASQPARTDGTFLFENSNTGTKLFRLVDTASQSILAESAPLTGLVRSYAYKPTDPSYGTPIQNQSYLYDQSVSVFAALSEKDETTANTLLQGMLQLQTVGGSHDGGFILSAPQLSPSYAPAEYRTGTDAIAVDALLTFLQLYPNDTNSATYKAAALKGLAYLQTTLSTQSGSAGLYLGGFGDYTGTPQTFDPTITLTWASTEHNVDIWQTLKEAHLVLDGSGSTYSTEANTLSANIMAKLYDTTDGRLIQGYNDTADPLDVTTWGSIYLSGSGNTSQAQAASSRLGLFAVTQNGASGYEPFYASTGYPGAVPTIWYEGSFGALLMEYRLDNTATYKTLLASLSSAQNADGSFVYATNADGSYALSTNPAIASTAWFILATLGRNVIWNSCTPTS